jgi:hypothetical protein
VSDGLAGVTVSDVDFDISIGVVPHVGITGKSVTNRHSSLNGAERPPVVLPDERRARSMRPRDWWRLDRALRLDRERGSAP